jgi:hypothetical protein
MGRPTEALLKAIIGKEFAIGESETRLVEGESAGSTITLPAAVLRSTALTILGTGGMPSWDILTDVVPTSDEQRSPRHIAHRDRACSARGDRRRLGTRRTRPKAGRDPLA